jgi:predicted transposase YdaD
VQEAPLAEDVRDILTQVLEFWFFERFRGLTAKELWAMLNLVTPIQETKAYQSIFAEGEIKGEAKGKAETLKHQLRRRFDTMPAWAEQRIDAASIAQLDAWLDGIFDVSSVEALIGTERN